MTTVPAAVEDQAVAIVSKPFLHRDLGRDRNHVSYQEAILRLDIVDGGDVLARKDQEVDRCGRMDICDRDAVFILMQTAARDLTA